MEKSVCPLCNSKLILVDNELVCETCGYVSQDIQIASSEFEQKIFYELGSHIGFKNLYSQENISRIGESSSPKYYRMLSERWLKTSKENEEYYCMKVISRVCEKLTIPENVAAYAFEFSKRILSKKLEHEGITIPIICLYSLMISCKKSKIDRITMRKLFKTFRTLGYRVSLAALAKVSCLANMALEPKPVEEYLTTIIPSITAHPVVLEKVKKYYLSPVEYERKLYRTTIAILSYVDKYRRGGHNPYALASTATYAGEIALSKIEHRQPLFSQRIISESVDIAEYTVREQYSELFREAVYQLISNLNQ
ncbi:MAG: hypothetical protein N3F64_02350 [Nitrososphaeria archaeon]|nr:hypothetical protein [Nitrososphaeria archaeon]